MPGKTILVDLTPYQTTHRFRGIGRYVRDLASGLAEVLAESSSPHRVLPLAFLEGDGTPQILDDFSLLRPVIDDRALDAADAPVRWRRRLYLGRAAKRVGASCVHLPDARGTPLSSIARVVTCHDLIPLRFSDRYLNWKDGGAPLRRLRDARRFRGASRVIAISEETKRDLISLLSVDPAAISVAYNGVDLGQWSADRGPDDDAIVAQKQLEQRPYLLYVGAFEWRKNAVGMVAALGAARRQGVDLTLAWVGKLSVDESRALFAMAAEHGVEDRVQVLGFVDDRALAALYRRSLAHVMISLAEGFGLTLVEAMSCGAPVLSTAGSSLAEVAGDAALLVDPQDHADVTRGIVQLARDPELRRQLGERGKTRSKRFSHLAFARATLAVYQRVLDA